MPLPAALWHRRLAPSMALAILVAACTPTAPSPAASPSAPPPTPVPTTATPSPSAAAANEVYAAIRGQVEAIRGLQPTADVDPVTIDEAQLKANLEAEFDKANHADDLRFSEDSLILLGLLPKGSSLRALTLDFQAGQVAGYYSPDAKELYVVSRSGGIGAAEKVTYAHEFTHQLDDQRFDLAKLATDSANQSDRSLAQLGLIEGDAVSVQTTWTVQNLTPKEMGELLQASLDPDAIAALQRAPAYLRDTALFPYQNGLTFVSGLLAGGGYDAVDAAYARPPDSTEQILHPEKYASREQPMTVKIPVLFSPGLPAGWKARGRDTLGEFILKTWLGEGGVPLADASAAAAGWGGDRLELYDSPNGTSLLLVTEWDRLVDASEFAAAAEKAIDGLGLHGAVTFDEHSPTVAIALGDDASTITARISR